jgi:hypothetical protein
LNDSLLNNQWVIKERRGRSENFWNENTSYQNLWDISKIVQRRKLIVMSAYMKKSETSQINNLMTYLELLEKQKQAKHKISRWKEIIKIMTKLNEIETKRIKRNNETRIDSLK